jgi:hypothetical protein
VILVYAPEGSDEQRWDLAETKVTFAEAKAAEKAGGIAWVKLEEELTNGNVAALQAALWVLRKRTEPALRFADLEDLPIGSVRTEYSDDEKAFFRAAVEADSDMTDAEKAATLQIMGIADAEPAPKGK